MFDKHYRVSRLFLRCILLIGGCALLILSFMHREARAETSPNVVNAFFLNSVPADYAQREKFFAALKEGGANTVIIGPAKSGLIDKESLPNTVFLAHQAGLRIFFILPIRNIGSLIDEHSDWEDMLYDLGSGTVQHDGRLDLFNSEAMDYLAKAYQDVASYFMDGILLGEDFYYGDIEGMSPAALEAYKIKHHAALSPGRAIARVGSDDDKLAVLEGGEGFKEWLELKKDRLVETLQKIITACRTVNGDIRFGIPLHISGFTTPQDVLQRYAYDMEAFKNIKIDYYWIAIPHRDMRAGLGLSYKKSMESLSRIAQATGSSVKDPARTIVAVQTTYTSGKILPYSEIEEVAAQVKKSGDPGMAFILGEDILPATLTKKLFKRE